MRPLVFAVLVVFSAGCGDPAARRGRTYGSVTVGGKPLTTGTVRFFALTGGVGSDGPIADGRYDMPPARGLSAGKYRVEISSERPTGKKVPDRDAGPGDVKDEVVETVPAKYNRDSNLQIDYDPAADKPHDFALTGK